MEKGRASITSLITAYSRAHHFKYDEPKIFNDTIAFELIGKEEWEYLSANLARSLEFFDPEAAAACRDQQAALKCVMRLQNGACTLSRSRYAEDCLSEEIERGVKQYVILGAGLDTYAFRNPEVLENIHVFELDHPATQADKLERLARAGFGIHRHLRFVPIDFSKEDVGRVLMGSSYDKNVPSLFSWLGVTFYLERETVLSTLEAIADISAPGSIIVFDYFESDAFIPGKAGKRVQLMQEAVRRAGEPMKTGFDPACLASDISAIGLELLEDLGPDNIEARYFRGRTDGFHSYEHFHLVKAIAR